MKKQLKNGVQTKSRFTKAHSETNTSKELKTQKSKVLDRSKRGEAIRQALWARHWIGHYIESLRERGPQTIGDDAYDYFPDYENAPRQVWGNRLEELKTFLCDEIFAATLAYEDAVFFPTETKEEEK